MAINIERGPHTYNFDGLTPQEIAEVAFDRGVEWAKEFLLKNDKEDNFPIKIDWEKRRYELSKEFLLRVHFTPEVFDACLGQYNKADTIAQVAVMMADALIKHLREDETEQSD